METRTEPGGGLRFAVLGPVRAWRGDEPLGTGAPQQRALLAALLLRGGRTATASELLDAVWGETPPNTALAALRSYAFRLRKALGPDALVTDSGGYALNVAPDALDSTVVERLAAEADRARASDPAQARHLLASALELWHGEPLAGLPGPYAETQRVPAGRVAHRPGRDPARPRPGTGRAHRGRLRTDRAVRRTPAARTAARPADAGPVPQRPAGRGARRLRRHPPPARRRTRHRPLGRTHRPAPAHPGGRPGPGRAARRRRGAYRDHAARATPGHRRRLHRPGRLRQRTGRATGRRLAGQRRHGGLRGGRHRRRRQDHAGRARRPRAPGTPSPTGSCTSTSRAPSRGRPTRRSYSARSCGRWACPTRRSPTRSPSAPRSTAPRWTAAGCWPCSTTPTTPRRSGSCCPAPPAARRWSPAGCGWSTWPARTWWTWT